MPKRTLFLIFALFIITLILLVVTSYNPSAKISMRDKTIKAEKEKSTAQTTLSFGNVVIATSSSIPVNIEASKNKVTAVQLELQYDPEILTNVVASPGSFFKNPIVFLNKIDEKTGRISYAIGIRPEEKGISGKGITAIFSFETKPTTFKKTSILFLPKTLVTAEGISGSALKQANNTTLSY